MKKILAMLLVLVFCCTCVFVGCGKDDKEPAGNKQPDAQASANKDNPISSNGVVNALDGKPVPSLKGKTIAVTVLGTDHDWDLNAYKGQIDRIKELGGEVIALDGERNDAKHIADIESLILQKPDAIIKQLGTFSIYEPVLKKVRDAGIPLFTVDFASQHSICCSTSDNYLVGELLARTMFEMIGAEGKVAAFNGFHSEVQAATRYDMMRYVAKVYPRITFVEPDLVEVIPGTVDDAYKQILDLMKREPDVKAIWMAWDIPAIGVARALREINRTDVKIFCIDGSDSVLHMINEENSPVAVDMAQQPYLIGQTAVDMCARYLAGEKVPSTVYVDPVMVTKDNYDEAMERLGKKK